MMNELKTNPTPTLMLKTANNPPHTNENLRKIPMKRKAQPQYLDDRLY